MKLLPFRRQLRVHRDIFNVFVCIGFSKIVININDQKINNTGTIQIQIMLKATRQKR
jgi:hypothetical protein